jgi:hypothetical protein
VSITHDYYDKGGIVMKIFRMVAWAGAAFALFGLGGAAEGTPTGEAASLARLRSVANLYTITRFTLVFEGIEKRKPRSLSELLSVPYSPFSREHFINPYTGKPVEEWAPERIWELLDRSGTTARYGGRDKMPVVVEASLGQVADPSIPYGSITAVDHAGTTVWALVTYRERGAPETVVQFWSEEEPRESEKLLEVPLSPAEYRAGLDMRQGIERRRVTYRKWFSWVKDPSERKLIFLCSEMAGTFRRVASVPGWGFQPSRWKEALQYAYDHGWQNLLDPTNPYTGGEMVLTPYSRRSEGGFWIYQDVDFMSTEPVPVNLHLPSVMCYGKDGKILFPTPNEVWNLLWRTGQLEYPEPPRWWLNSGE